MDIVSSFNEKIIIIGKNYKINFKLIDSIDKHYAILGVGTIIDNYPLLADATNEKGLSIAALNFPGNAYYHNINQNKDNLAPYELMLYLLANCSCVDEVKEKMKTINIVNIDFSTSIKLTPLHFMISDKDKSIVIESCKDMLHIYDNPYNVLTNNPTFPYHIENIKNYMNLTIDDPINIIDRNINIRPYSYNLGLIGLPGDFSSASRFIKALFIKNNIILQDDENSVINSFFYCLNSVFMVKGLVKVKDNFEYTRYQTCVNVNKLILYYKTYDNPTIMQIKLSDYDINNVELICLKM